MLASASTASTTWGVSSPSWGDEQVQDLESLAQRLRVLEMVLAPSPPPPSTSTTQPLEASTTGDQSPNEDVAEDIVSTMSPSRRVSGDGRHGSHQSQNSLYRQHHTPGSLSRRIKNMESSLWAAAKERKPTEEFLLKCKLGWPAIGASFYFLCSRGV